MPLCPICFEDVQFNKPEYAAIHPSKPFAILDDSQVIEINARKVIGNDPQLWYEVHLLGE